MVARATKTELRLIECICTDERLLRQRIEHRGQQTARLSDTRLVKIRSSRIGDGSNGSPTSG